MLEPLWLQAAAGGVLGLLIGSFLNVVIHRLPKMMEHQWVEQCADLNGQAAPEQAPFNLLTPRSRCPHCGHGIRWFENVPMVSWLLLRGRCSQCHARISARYPLVEIATAGLFALCTARWGLTPTAGLWCLFSAALLSLALIDWDTTLLPDSITLPLLWIALVGAALGWTSVPLPDAVWGAVGGYMSLWLIYWGFKLLTGKEGMGYGDFKLLAMLGAWGGWQVLPLTILLSSLVGAVLGVIMLRLRNQETSAPIPFGPYLAIAGWIALLWGDQITGTYLQFAGFR